MKPRTVRLRFSVRGADGESEHALVAVMRRRRYWTGAKAACWRCVTLELRWRGRTRNIPLYKLNATQLDELSVQAERAAGARAHD